MFRVRILWLIHLLLLFAAVFLAYRAWMGLRASSVVVEWTTGSELDTAGFNLYRSESPEGSQTQVNSSLIPASPDPLAGGAYEYTDRQVTAGRTYFYTLEEVEFSGTTTRYDPVSVKAQRSGVVEGVGSLVLFGVAIAGFRRLRPHSKARQPEPPTGEEPAL